jgi:serine/threonine protein kinase
MIVFDSGQQQLTLGEVFGTGGEATVYRVDQSQTLLAKIYRKEPRPGYHRKLLWMQRYPPKDSTQMPGHISIAWPVDLLYNLQNQLAGYLMPQVYNATSILDVFNPRRRMRILPGFNRKYLHRTARNLATALVSLHESGYIVGDINESNIMVTPSAMVALIDTDSFQVTAGNEVFSCPVGKPEYTPPELQGVAFQRTLRTTHHDAFGLAVLIFQLLMNGSHPFRAQWLGPGDPPPLEERMRKNCFPYIIQPECPVAPPRNAPGLDILDPRLADLFRQGFIDGYTEPPRRPTPTEWAKALFEAEKALVQCDRGHFRAPHLAECPECEQARRYPAVTRPPARHPKPVSPATVQPAALPPQPNQTRLRWQLWLVVAAATIVLVGTSLLVAEMFFAAGSVTVATHTPQPTFTASPTAMRLERSLLPTATATAVSFSTPTDSVTNDPVFTPAPLPTATPTKTPAPTTTPDPALPMIDIVLPAGNRYSPGDNIRVELDIQGVNGIGNIFWWVSTNDTQETVVIRDRQWCDNQTECRISKEFTNLPAGTFTISVAAFDSLNNSTVRDTQVFVE